MQVFPLNAAARPHRQSGQFERGEPELASAALDGAVCQVVEVDQEEEVAGAAAGRDAAADMHAEACGGHAHVLKHGGRTANYAS
eukprot:6209317-Pleurochrysis_carterae.AAC.1